MRGNDGWVDDKKALLHAKIWDVYVKKKKCLIGYSVEVVGSGGKKVLCEVVDNHVLEGVDD